MKKVRSKEGKDNKKGMESGEKRKGYPDTATDLPSFRGKEGKKSPFQG